MKNREPTPRTACGRHADALAALVDGALDPRDRGPLDDHLAGCTACRDLLADLHEIRSLAGELEPIEPPARV
jgi:anti-sigma factor RsiW